MNDYVCIARVSGGLAAALLLSIVMGGCDERKRADRPRIDATQAGLLQVAAQGDAAGPKADDGFVRDGERALQRLRAEIDALGERARQATGEARARLERRIAELEPRWREAQARLDEARGKADAALRDARERFGEAFESLRQSIRDAKKEFDRS